MKTLITIIGPNGVGKSTTAEAFLQKCPRCAYVDADWCRVIHPFAFTEATRRTVTENLYCLLRNYLLCEDIDTVVFPYGWHGARKGMYETDIRKLRDDGIEFEEKILILKCSLKENIERAEKNGRDKERIARGIENTFSFYDGYVYPCIDTTELTPEQAAREVFEMVRGDSILMGQG